MLINIFAFTLLIVNCIDFFSLRNPSQQKEFIFNFVLTKYKLIFFIVWGISTNFGLIKTIFIIFFLIGELFIFVLFSDNFRIYFGCLCSILGLSFVPLIIFCNKPLILLCDGGDSFSKWAAKEGMKQVVKTAKKYPKSSKAAGYTFLAGTAAYTLLSGYDTFIDVFYLNGFETSLEHSLIEEKVYMNKAKLNGGVLIEADRTALEAVQKKIFNSNEQAEFFKSKKWFR